MTGGALGKALRHLRDLFSGRTVIGLTDGQLLERYVASNDGEAFEALVARHGPMVLATCRALLRHDHDVEDAFQATFFALACKARSVRSGDALGGWLRRVAHRVAVQASVEAKQRRRREGEVAAMGTSEVTRPGAEFEWRSILQEEIDRLPEGERLPVVLCDVQGLTHDQAAHQLDWTVPTLRCRLAKARKRLRARLTRRGLAPALLGLVIAPRQAPAAIPATWASAAVAAATGGTISATVAALTRVIIRGMLITKLKIAGTVVLTVVALVSLGVVAVSAGRSDQPDPATVARAVVEEPKGAKRGPVPETTPGTTFEYRGRVLGPDGQPVVGARLYVATQELDPDQAPRHPVGRATTGVDGRFGFEVPDADFDATWSDEPWKYAAVIATADGFAPALAIDFEGRRDLTLRLVKDDLTVEGRILDTDGRPAADARVQVVALLWPKSGDLTEWCAALKAEQGAYTTEHRLLYQWDVQSGANLFPVVETGADGRFTLKGIGRERVARLQISGPTIETKIVQVVTRPFETSHIPRFFRGVRPDRVSYYGPRFDHVAGPTQVVVGTVRDRDTGKPLAGVRVQGTNSLSNKDRFVVGTTSDAEGHYRLVGLPRQRESGPWRDSVVALPPGDEPYLTARLPLGDPPGPGALTLDFALKHGVWVTGRVTDQGTGKPTHGAVYYFVFQDNPHLKEAPDFSFGPANGRVHCDRDGRYRLPAMPGRGLVAARASEDRYRFGVGVDRIDGLTRKGPAEIFPTRPYPTSVKNYHTIVEVNPPEGALSVACDIQLDPGRPFKAKVIGPGGEPLGGCRISGLADHFREFEPVETADFEVPALGPEDTRVLLLMHVGKEFAGKAVIRPREPGPVTVKLEPWGVLSGRFVDADGQPRAGLRMRCPGALGTVDVGVGSLPDDAITVGKDGRFKAFGLVPGLSYTFELRDGPKPLRTTVKGGVLKAGETKDLGDLKIVEEPIRTAR